MMVGKFSIPKELVQDKPRLFTRLGVGLYVLLSLAYFVLGQTNTDEAWYLYASKLIYQGQMPFRDFAFTQTPLLPYIYGVSQVWRSSIALGRVVSVIISLGVLLLGIAIARRYAGARGGACAALFFAAFTFGIYLDTIVKTYALLSLLFLATILVLSGKSDEAFRLPLALLYGSLGVLLRVTALFFVVPIFIYVLVAAKRWRTRVLSLAVAAGATLTCGFFLLADWDAARWGIFDSHLRHWQGAQLSTQIYDVLAERLPDIVSNFGIEILIFSATLYFVLRQRGTKIWLTERLPISVAAGGLLLFAASHLVNGLWQTEYLVPAVVTFIPILAIVLADAYGMLENQSRVFAQGILAATLILLPLGESNQHIDFTGRRLPLAEVDQVANFVAQNSKPADQVMAFEAFTVVIDANRTAVPGATLAQFSLQLMDTPTSQRYGVVNTAMVADMAYQTKPAVILLTDRDWGLIRSTNTTDSINLQSALDQKYKVGMTLPLFGEFSDIVTVYLRQ